MTNYHTLNVKKKVYSNTKRGEGALLYRKLPAINIDG